jgi:hypothetical protein
MLLDFDKTAATWRQMSTNSRRMLMWKNIWFIFCVRDFGGVKGCGLSTSTGYDDIMRPPIRHTTFCKSRSSASGSLACLKSWKFGMGRGLVHLILSFSPSLLVFTVNWVGMSKEVHLTLMYSVSATCLLVFLIDDLELRVQFFVLETISSILTCKRNLTFNWWFVYNAKTSHSISRSQSIWMWNLKVC